MARLHVACSRPTCQALAPDNDKASAWPRWFVVAKPLTAVRRYPNTIGLTLARPACNMQRAAWKSTLRGKCPLTNQSGPPRSLGRAPQDHLSRRHFFPSSHAAVLVTAGGSVLSPSAAEASSTSGNVGGTLNWLGWSGEDAKAQTKSWLASHHITLNRTSLTGQSDIHNALEVGKPLDLVNPYNGYLSLLFDAGLIQPINLSKVPNFAGLWPGLKNAPWLHGPQGQVLAVPDIWATAPISPIQPTCRPPSREVSSGWPTPSGRSRSSG